MAASGFRSPTARRYVSSVSIVALVVEGLYGVSRHLTGQPPGLPTEVMVASLVLFACGCVAFLSWVWRAHKNLVDLGVGGLTITPGWAVGWWFIPIANLFKPYLSMRELWWASDPSDEPGRGFFDAASRLPLLWWLCFILYNFYLEVFARVPLLDTGVRVSTAVAGVVAAACILFMMAAVDARQSEMAGKYA